MEQFSKASMLLFVLLNPFFLSVYLTDLIRDMHFYAFARVLVRGSLIALTVFLAFAWTGDWMFTDLLQARFASFLIFGGLVLLIIGLRFALNGTEALRQLRGTDPQSAASMIAMPFMIGPGTVSASVLAGANLGVIPATFAIVISVGAVVISVLVLKKIFDFVKTQNERFVAHYVDIVGRIMSLVIGTVAVELILQGVEQWLAGLGIIQV